VKFVAMARHNLPRATIASNQETEKVVAAAVVVALSVQVVVMVATTVGHMEDLMGRQVPTGGATDYRPTGWLYRAEFR